MNSNIRREIPADYKKVEEVTREAFFKQKKQYVVTEKNFLSEVCSASSIKLLNL